MLSLFARFTDYLTLSDVDIYYIIIIIRRNNYAINT